MVHNTPRSLILLNTKSKHAISRLRVNGCQWRWFNMVDNLTAFLCTASYTLRFYGLSLVVQAL